MRFVLALLTLFQVAGPTGTQTDFRKGTVIVFGYSTEKIVIAADSRVRSRSGFTDDECKISQLSKTLVFTSSGTTRIESTISTLTWDAHAVAREALLSAPSGAETKVVAEAWGNLVAERWNQAILMNWKRMEPFLKEIREVDRDRLTLGVFVGLQRDGRITLVQTVVIYLENAFGRGTAQPITVEANLTDKMEFGAMGRAEIANEFLAGQSERAKEWNLAWEKRGRGNESDDAELAILLVELTIAFHPNRISVGGPVDACELRRDGGVRWIRKKDDCRTTKGAC